MNDVCQAVTASLPPAGDLRTDIVQGMFASGGVAAFDWFEYFGVS
jgi:hypothetical protein